MSKHDEIETMMSCANCDSTFTAITDSEQAPPAMCIVCGEAADVVETTTGDSPRSTVKLGDMVDLDCPDCGVVTVVCDDIEEIAFCPVCGYEVVSEDEVEDDEDDDEEDFEETDD
jgi:rRNA maturation endonuclease Nob1